MCFPCLLGKTWCHACAHRHHTVTMKTSNSVVEDMIIFFITMITYNRRLIQHENQLNSLLAEIFPWCDYVTHAQ